MYDENEIVLQICEITVKPGRREATPAHIRAMADSLSSIGLLNAITIDRNHVLIAGLHRLEAAKLLGWDSIRCLVIDLDNLQAELAEIDENFIRMDLLPVERGDLLARRKEIYESIYPETRQGMRNGQTAKSDKVCKNDKMSFLEPKPFTQDTSDKYGISPKSNQKYPYTPPGTT